MCHQNAVGSGVTEPSKSAVVVEATMKFEAAVVKNCVQPERQRSAYELVWGLECMTALLGA